MLKKLLLVVLALSLAMSSGFALADQATLTEAPDLAALVAEGKLPPVAERLPVADDIMIEPVVESIGTYGGIWHMTWGGPDDKWAPGKMTEEALFRFKQDGSGVEPNVAKGYDVNEDSTVFTIYLREGMKWSDGVPFTANDCIFYWEHMLLKETFGKQLYDCYYSTNPETGDKVVCTVEKVDDYTIRITHAYSFPLFLERVAIDNKWFYMPEHYFSTILPEFIGDDAALKKAKEMGFSDIAALGKWTGYYGWIYPEIPTLRAWVPANDPNDQTFLMKRNPYYFKTDAAGQQLPYIDTLSFEQVQDDDHAQFKRLSGELECGTVGLTDYTVLMENREKGNYSVRFWESPSWSSTYIEMNQTTQNDNIRALFQDIRFREAMSVCANREEISEICLDGLADPAQSAVPEGLANYQEGWAEKWIDYDPDRANALLDEMGLAWNAAHDCRVFADGTEVEIVLNYVQGSAMYDQFAELMANYIKAVGVRVNVKPIDNSLFLEKKYNNELEMCFEGGGIGLIKVSYRPDAIVPLRVLTPWYGWYGLYNATNGAEGIAPEGDVAKLLEYWGKITSAKSSDEVNEWSDKLIKLHMDNMWVIGYTSATPVVLVVSNNMRNVPESIVDCDEFRGMGHAHPAQFYYAE